MNYNKNGIVEIVKKILEINTEAELKTDAHLKEYGLNSLSLVNLIVEIEEYLEIEIRDEDLYDEKFRTINDIFNLLEKYS